MSERSDSRTCCLSSLFNLIPAVIVTKNLPTLPQLVSDIKTYENDLPRYENRRTESEDWRANSMSMTTPLSFY